MTLEQIILLLLFLGTWLFNLLGRWLAHRRAMGKARRAAREAERGGAREPRGQRPQPTSMPLAEPPRTVVPVVQPLVDVVATPPVPPVPAGAWQVRRRRIVAPRSEAELKHAFAMAEILNPPRSLKPWDS